MSYPEKPVILQIIPELAAGGAERTAVEIAAAIVKAGALAFVACEGGRLVSEPESAGGQFVPLKAKTKNPASILINAARIARFASARGVHLIHARSRAPAWSARIAARRLGLPFVTTYHGVYNQRGPLKAVYNSVMASGDAVIANSEFTAAVIRKRHKTPPERLHVIHRGVDLSIFDPASVSDTRVQRLRLAWNVEPEQRIVLFAARLTRWKGQEEFIDALTKVKSAPELKNVIFVFAGDAQGRAGYEQQLRMKVAKAGLGERVRFAGHCADMPAAFKASAFSVVAPSGQEAFGRVSVESQAMSCPVLAVDSGALCETLSPQLRPDWLIPAHDAGKLAAAIRAKCGLDAGNLRVAGGIARAFTAAQFSIEHMQARTLHVYDSLTGSSLTAHFNPDRSVFPFLPELSQASP